MAELSGGRPLDAAELERLARAPGVLACDGERLVIRTSAPFRMSRAARVACIAGALIVPTLVAVLAWKWLIGPVWIPAAGAGLAAGASLAYVLLMDLRLVAQRGGEGVLLERFNTLTHRKTRVLVIPRAEVDGHHVKEALEGPPGSRWVDSELHLLRAGSPISVWGFPEHEQADLAGRHLVDLMRREASA